MARVASLRRPQSKYGAVKTTVDGITFHSAKEASRYAELKLLERAGEIRRLALQPSFRLEVFGRGERGVIGLYYADFAYEERVGVNEARGRVLAGAHGYAWRRIVEDVKGFKTPLYKWKKRHVEMQYGITIREV